MRTPCTRLALLTLLVGCQDAGVTKHNALPTANITSHTQGDTVYEGDTVELRGTVGDPDGDAADLLVTWTVDGTAVCGPEAPDAAGGTGCATTFLPDGGAVILEVVDAGGGSATDRIELSVIPTDAPVATILTPDSDSLYYSDQPIAFTGTVADAEDDPTDLTVSWETDTHGDLGLDVTVDSSGSVEAHGTLAEGTYTVRLRAVDTTGKEGIDTVSLEVGPANAAPTCGISVPTDRSAFAAGSEVIFEGSVDDVNVGPTGLTAIWTSDLDGELRTSVPDSDGSVSFATSALTDGTHRVTLTATDEVGVECTDSVFVTIGQPPTLVVNSPTSGDIVNEGAETLFSATVGDAEDLPTDLEMSWISDIDAGLSVAGADSSGEASFRTSSLSPGAHIITVTVTDTDGLSTVDTLHLDVNAVPTAPTVTLDPDPAITTDTLTATASGSADPDGGSITYGYTWYVDGALSGVSTTDTFPSASTAKHSTYMVEVVAFDGIGFGPATTASVTVDNADPILSGPSLSASTVVRGDVLTCAASATDPDPSDTPTVTYAWSDGSTGSSFNVPATAATGDTYTCTATADDGDGGVVSASATATVVNTPPSVSSVSLSPTTLYTNDTVTVSATISDADGDAVTTTYEWTVDGVVVASGTSNSLDGATYFDKDEVVAVNVIADDGADTTTVSSSGITVLNTPPTAPVVTISPASPDAGDSLYCEVTTASYDADGDAITYTMEWDVDGVVYEAGGSLDSGLDSGDPGWAGPYTTTWTDDTTTGADLYYEETWTCEATPNDGDDDGTIASDSVTSSSDSTDFVIFVTDPFLGSSSASWLTDRADADAYCASEAASEGITGSDWSIMYSTGSEDARDHVDYDSSRGDRVFDRNGRQVDNGDLWSTSYVLPDMNSWTIVSTGTSGTFQSCSGSYPSGSWPICQYCSQKFACGSSSDRPFVPGDCCWTGTRSVICLGKL